MRIHPDSESPPSLRGLTRRRGAISFEGARGCILEMMTTPQRPRRRHLASSPFQPEIEAAVEHYDCGDLVSHDVHGLGSVVAVDPEGVTVKFGTETRRIVSPFAKMEKL